MDDRVRRALNQGGEAVRVALLEYAAEARRGIGLGAESELSVLQLASLYDDEAAEQLLAGGCDWDLHSACALGDEAAIRRLASPSAFAALAEHLTPMGFALVRSRLASVRAMLELGDDPNRPLPRIGFFAWEMEALAAGHGGWLPLQGVCAHGYAGDAAAIATALIQAGARLDAPCPLGTLPLHLTAIYGWLPVMHALLGSGADIEARTQPISSALWRMSSPEGAEPASALTPLMEAAREGRYDAAWVLLEQGAALDVRDSLGRTPLHAAAAPWWKESTDLVELLLDSGAEVDAVDHQGRTPLDIATAAGNERTAAILERTARTRRGAGR